MQASAYLGVHDSSWGVSTLACSCHRPLALGPWLVPLVVVKYCGCHDFLPTWHIPLQIQGLHVWQVTCWQVTCEMPEVYQLGLTNLADED